MKSPILCLPIVLQALLVVALHARKAPTADLLTPAQRDVERRELRHQLNTISARLETLEVSPAFVPRGIGEEASVQPGSAPSTSLSITAAALATFFGSQPPALPTADAVTLVFFRGTTRHFLVHGHYNVTQPNCRTNRRETWAAVRPGSLASGGFHA